jgi:hypothetical protein
MGAGASFERDGRIYKPMTCGCIYACDYYDQIAEKVKLVKCCHECLESLKTRKFNTARFITMQKNVQNKHVNDLIDNPSTGWLSKISAMELAEKNGIRCMEEFLYNTNIIDRFGIPY